MQASFACANLARTWLLAAVLAASAAAAVAQTAPLERGRYLVTTIMACGNCHTTRDAEGQPIASKELAGGSIAIDVPPFTVVAANITPDKETGIGSWTDAEIKRAITHGERPNHGPNAGKPLAVMAVNFFKALLPGDLDAIVAYLRSVPAVRNQVATPVYRAPPAPEEPYPEAERGFTEGDMQDKVRRGAYLATIGHCLECHTPAERGVGQYKTALGAGGQAFMPSFVKGLAPSWKGAVSRNITSHREQGLGAWSDAEIKRAITRGVSRDGRKLELPMAIAWYAGIRDEDLDAIVAYLRTLAPQPQ